MKIHLYYVYILTNSSNKVLYVGVTKDLEIFRRGGESGKIEREP
jgi:predicted GIY-YIG superfamily endonuclease